VTFNRTHIVAPLLAVAVAAGFRAVAADPAGEATLRQALSREYVRYNRALAAKNIPAILDMLTPDFAWKVGDGKTLNRQQTRAALQEYLGGIHSVKRAAFRVETVSSQAPGRARVVVVEPSRLWFPANAARAGASVPRPNGCAKHGCERAAAGKSKSPKSSTPGKRLRP